MEPLTIKLHLNEHCIETAAKMELKNLTDLYFNTNDNPDMLLKKIELLQAFIEKSDFPKLRASDERLAGIKETFVYLSMDNSNNVALDIKER